MRPGVGVERPIRPPRPPLQPLLPDGTVRGLLGLGAGLPARVLRGIRLLPQQFQRRG